MCWYCFWGWPRPVADIYDRAVADVDGDENELLYGPAHIVWADENFEDEHIHDCIADCDARRNLREFGTEAGLAVVRRSMVELLAVPEAVRCCEPDDYDNKHPENFPPPVGLEMVRR